MTAEEDALLRILEARVTQMALEYKALKDRYAALSRIMEEKKRHHSRATFASRPPANRLCQLENGQDDRHQ